MIDDRLTTLHDGPSRVIADLENRSSSTYVNKYCITISIFNSYEWHATFSRRGVGERYISQFETYAKLEAYRREHKHP